MTTNTDQGHARPAMTATDPTTPSPGECRWAMAAHLTALCLYLGLFGLNLLFPYLIRRWQRERSGFVSDHALAAFNFQVTVTAAGLAAILAAMAWPLFWAVVIAVFTVNIVLIGKAADLARAGRPYRYPLTIHWLKVRRDTSEVKP